MAANCRRKAPGIIFKRGKATAVIRDIDDYQKMFERLEDAEDLIMLMELGQKPLRFRRLEDYLEAMTCSQFIN